jgi:hypothetical protein
MRQRYLILLSALGVLAVVSWAALSLAVQNTTTAPKPAAPPTPAAVSPKPATPAKPTATIPRTPWGEPDLQGTWFVLADVPLQRSAANANKEFLTDEEMAASDKQKGLNPGRNARSANSVADVDGAYNAVFNSVLKTGRRTSMIIDPPDGHIPPTVAAAAPAGGARGGLAGRGAAPAGGPRGAQNQNDNPETLAQNPRCLGVQMPFIPNNTLFAQGTVMQIVQSPKSMGIYMEDDHAGGGNRVILMDGRPHLPSSMKTVLGDSRGKWEGNTLVVETTNYTQGYRGANPDSFKTIERFTRVGPNDLKREITFDDSKTWTRPWTVLIEMGKTDDKRHMIFDSACHEGNYGMTGILAGARKEEAAAKK